MMDVLIILMVANISQCILNQHVVHLTYIQILLVNHASIKLKELK